ncbi:MAG: vWA domain-containing protein [Thermomicrobiales bacterium]
MGVLAPLGLALLALAAPIVALYMLRMRRREREVSSTLLWEQALRDVRANAPWQRLRPSLLLVLQLLALLALVAALARPFWLGAPPLGENLVAIVDVSGSMSATDVTPTRLDRAKTEARNLIDNLPSGGQMTIIAAGAGAQVVQPATSNRAALRAALDGLRGQAGATDFAEAFALATPAAERLPDTAVVIISDGAFTPPTNADLRAPVRFIRVGERADNLGITAAATRRGQSGNELFVRVQNFGPTERQTLLSVYDGQTLLDARALTVPASGDSGTTIPLPPGAGVLHATLDTQDDLALDNQVWIRPGASGTGRVLLTTAGSNTFLDRGLALLPNMTVEKAENGTSGTGGDYDLYVYDGVAPPKDVRGPVLLIDPPADNGLVTVAGGLDRPVVTDQARDDPIMKGVDLSKIQIASAAALDQPDWARALASSSGRPLLLAGETNGRRVAVLAFDLHKSDLPLTLNFPILLANLTAWLAPDAGSGVPDNVSPGAVATITPRPGVDSVVITDPAGRDHKLVPARGAVLFTDTGQPGAYTVREMNGDREVRRDVLTVNLLSADESNIAPQTPQLTSAAPAANAAPSRAQREFWRPVLLIGLAVLTVEWWVFYRGLRLPPPGAWRGAKEVRIYRRARREHREGTN